MKYELWYKDTAAYLVGLDVQAVTRFLERLPPRNGMYERLCLYICDKLRAIGAMAR